MKMSHTPAYDEEAVSLLEEIPVTEKSLGRIDEKKMLSRYSMSRSTLQSHISQCLLFLLPSFISSRFTRQDRPSETLRPTAYLDGLRGIAAWTVLNAHLSAILTKGSGAGFGYGGANHEIYKLPILRLLYNGNFAVALFFVISGFALSISFVSTLRKSQPDHANSYKKLASSIFRRPMRLFLPSWVSMFVVFWLIRFNFFGRLQTRENEFVQLVDGWPVLGSWPPRQPSFFAQLMDMLSIDGDMLQIFVQSTHQSFDLAYNPVLWTIKLEFRASLVLFLTQAALYFLEKRARVIITLALIVFGVSVSGLDAPHFWAGYLICEFTDLSAPSKNRGFLKTMLYTSMLLVGLFLGSFAAWEAQHTAWCSWLIPLTPFNFQPLDRFWVGIGAGLTVWSFNGLPFIVNVCNSRIVQYFGKISFALYLVHFWMVHGFGTLIFYNVWSITGKTNPTLSTIGFFIAYSILLFLIVWVADIFWRCVDIPLVNVAARWQQRMFRKD